MFNTSLKTLIILVCSLCTTPCFGDALKVFHGHKGNIKIAGGTAHIPVMKEAARRIMTQYKDIVITIAGGGSGVGIKQVGEGIVDIGNSGRKPKPEEIERYGLVLHKWAIDGVAVIVNQNNKVRSLTNDQLKGIYAGQITNWKSIGGQDHSITLYTRDESSGTRSVFWKKALNKGMINLKALFVPSNGAMKTAIANDPYGIGYVSVGHIDHTVTPVVLDGIKPTLENVKTGQYKIVRALYSNTKGAPSELTQLFIEYLLTPDGQKIVADNGFIPVK